MDREEKLKRLKAARETAAAAKEEAERLRDELVEELVDEGQVYFVDEHGVKQRAYYSESDATIVDIDELRKAVRQRKITAAVFNDVVKLSPNTERLKAAMATGRIPKDVVQKAMKVIPGGKAKTIKFGDPSDASSSSVSDTS